MENKEDPGAQEFEVEDFDSLESFFNQDKQKKAEIGAQRIEDTQKHRVTKTGGKTHETTIWEIKDPRKAKFETFRGWHGIEWALRELVIHTNQAIKKGEIPGKEVEIGDTIQACVVNYVIPSENKAYSPKTTEDSPYFATLPYKIIKAEEGYLTTKLAIPKEMTMHMNLPTTVGELIVTLSKEKQKEMIITLQLKEATHRIENEEELSNFLNQPTKEYSESIDEQAADYFGDGLRSQYPTEIEKTPVITTPNTQETQIISEEKMREILEERKKLSERLRNINLDLKF